MAHLGPAQVGELEAAARAVAAAADDDERVVEGPVAAPARSGATARSSTNVPKSPSA
jgi:hypothetical protein